jgi:hypothetical protein
MAAARLFFTLAELILLFRDGPDLGQLPVAFGLLACDRQLDNALFELRSRCAILRNAPQVMSPKGQEHKRHKIRFKQRPSCAFCGVFCASCVPVPILLGRRGLEPALFFEFTDE